MLGEIGTDGVESVPFLEDGAATPQQACCALEELVAGRRRRALGRNLFKEAADENLSEFGDTGVGHETVLEYAHQRQGQYRCPGQHLGKLLCAP